MRKLIYIFVIAASFWTCGDDKESDTPSKGEENPARPLYESYTGLVMAGYQGWFNTPADGMGLDWNHYSKSGKFEPGYCTIEFWPEMKEYPQRYITPFVHPNGQAAYVFSESDYSTTDTHFRWMKEYGLDGVFLQRFLSGVISSEEKLRQRQQVTRNVVKASEKYERVWCMMYDMSGTAADDLMKMADDWKQVCEEHKITDPSQSPTYLHHNGKPLLAIWGVAFDSDTRNYEISDIRAVIEKINENDEFSIMLGVPYQWRTLDGDTKPDPDLHNLIIESDIIMPWAVGRYNTIERYKERREETMLADLVWCEQNEVDYAPMIFPGSSTGNLKDDGEYDHTPRLSGDFFWAQAWGAHSAGAESIYIAMFDEMDEGTAIFKCLHTADLPSNGAGRFVGIDDDVQTDHYLWLTGELGKMMRGEGNYIEEQPIR